ncbi:MAG TPA: hypothetical protein DCL66_06995 [Gammaproteobacteria bacterium]|nr:hypothetical protein [Gammaproteobacteria bacterium]
MIIMNFAVAAETNVVHVAGVLRESPNTELYYEEATDGSTDVVMVYVDAHGLEVEALLFPDVPQSIKEMAENGVSLEFLDEETELAVGLVAKKSSRWPAGV